MTSSESQDKRLISATPVLASLDIERSVNFFCEHLGFSRLYVQQDTYGVVLRDAVSIHFWSCADRHIAQNTSCHACNVFPASGKLIYRSAKPDHIQDAIFQLELLTEFQR
jgi:hypothetical protein